MIRINGRKWDELEIQDIQNILTNNDESHFFEFKANEVQNKKLVEEIVAFSNTYGGYVFLGVSDDKKITGCPNWTEERIHTLIHDSISPTPIFDVKKLDFEESYILIIKVEQGNQVPYITNTGKIMERIASGSYVIKESAKLIKLEERKKEFEEKIKRILSIGKITPVPVNVCGYLDKAFYPIFKDMKDIYKYFENIDVHVILNELREEGYIVYANKVGYSYIFTFGDSGVREGNTPANLGNFLEIMSNGAVRSRIVINYDENSEKANIANIRLLYICMEKIYLKIFGKDFDKHFINAYCYDELTVINRFEPYFEKKNSSISKAFEKKYKFQAEELGKNIIYLSNRFPTDGFYIASEDYLIENGEEVNSENLINLLFISEYGMLGLTDWSIDLDK